MVEGKIVLFGYLGDRLGAPQWEDKFFTPLNESIAGRANPDMYGPVIHANIASMVLNDDYIDGFGDVKAKSCSLIHLPSHKVIARSRIFSSSRILPGKG